MPEARGIFHDNEQPHVLILEFLQHVAENSHFLNRAGRHLLEAQLAEQEVEHFVRAEPDAADADDRVWPADGGERACRERALAGPDRAR